MTRLILIVLLIFTFTLISCGGLNGLFVECIWWGSCSSTFPREAKCFRYEGNKKVEVTCDPYDND